MGKVHRFFKKRFVISTILVSLLGMPLLVGCEPTMQTTEEEHTENNLTVSVDAGLVTKEFTSFVDDFAQKYHITVEINERPSGNAGENIVMTELLTNNASDILLFNSGGLFKSLDPKEYFYNLSSESYVVDYIDSYRQAVSVGEEVYGLPLGNADAIGFTYHKDIYSELGLTVPQNAETLETNFEKIKEAGITPILTPFKDQWLTQYYWYVGELSQPTEGEESYRQVLQKIDFWKDKNYFSENMLTMSLAMGLDDFGQQDSAHLLSQYSFKNYLISNHLVAEEELDFFPFPNKENAYIYMLPSSLYINKQTENLALCQSFFNEYFNEKVKELPATIEQPSILKDGEIQPDRIISEQEQTYKVDILPEILLDYFTNNISAEELIHQYQQRSEELQLIY